MPFAFFQLPTDASPEVASPLNAFLRAHRIVRVTRQWCEAGTESAWAFCVEYLEGPALGGGGFAAVLNGVRSGWRLFIRRGPAPEGHNVDSATARGDQPAPAGRDAAGRLPDRFGQPTRCSDQPQYRAPLGLGKVALVATTYKHLAPPGLGDGLRGTGDLPTFHSKQRSTQNECRNALSQGERRVYFQPGGGSRGRQSTLIRRKLAPTHVGGYAGIFGPVEL